MQHLHKVAMVTRAGVQLAEGEGDRAVEAAEAMLQ